MRDSKSATVSQEQGGIVASMRKGRTPHRERLHSAVANYTPVCRGFLPLPSGIAHNHAAQAQRKV